MTRLMGQEQKRISERIERLDAEREKLGAQLKELEIAERVLKRFGRKRAQPETGREHALRCRPRRRPLRSEDCRNAARQMHLWHFKRWNRLAARGAGRGIGGNPLARSARSAIAASGIRRFRFSPLAGARARRHWVDPAGSAGGRSRPCSPNIPRCARSRPNRGCSRGCGPRSRLATGT